MGFTMLDGRGKEQTLNTASANGVYRDENGVPRQVMQGDPIPPGWTPEGEVEDADEGTDSGPARPRRGAGKARNGPEEDK